MRKPGGFTLVEIMVALVVSGLALVAAVTAVGAQQRAFYNGQKIRAAQSAARSALLFLEGTLPTAGFGMDASLALDFGWYVPTTCPGDLSPCTPDKTSDADELILYARNPSYWVPADPAGEPLGRAWHVAAITASTVTVKARANDVFRRGQILQAVCNGEMRYAYFTVGQTVTVPAASATLDLDVTLEPVVATDPFHRQDVAVALPCVVAGGRLFQIDRYRFHVRPVAVDGRRDPFLVLDSGTDNDGDDDVDVDDEVLLAEGIEAFQVSYLFASPTLPVAGADPGTALTIRTDVAADTTAQAITRTTFPGVLLPGQFTYAPSSFYGYALIPPLPAARLTNHQGNVRTVRIALVARSPEPDPATSANLVWQAGSSLLRFNQAAAPAWVVADGGYQRTALETSVNLPNMTVRAIPYF